MDTNIKYENFKEFTRVEIESENSNFDYMD